MSFREMRDKGYSRNPDGSIIAPDYLKNSGNLTPYVNNNNNNFSNAQNPMVKSSVDNIVKANPVYNPNGNLSSNPSGGVMVTDWAKGNPHSKVSWNDDNKTVSVNGKEIPKNMTYLSPEGKSFVNKDYLDGITKYNPQGNLSEVPANGVKVTDYYRNIPDAHVTWDDDNKVVLFNGIPIPKEKTFLSSDGRSFVDRDFLDSMYNNSIARKDTAYDNIAKSITANNNMILDFIEEAKKPDRFRYDYRNDPNFKFYSDYYDRMGEKAISDAVGKMVGRNGGYLDSNVMSTAYQAKNDYNAQKANIIPELEQRAYDRHFAQKEAKDRNIANALTQLMQNNQNLISMRSDELTRDWQRDASYYDRELDKWKANYGFDVEKMSLELQKYGIDEETAMHTAKLIADNNYRYDALRSEEQREDRRADQTDRQLDLQEQKLTGSSGGSRGSSRGSSRGGSKGGSRGGSRGGSKGGSSGGGGSYSTGIPVY